MIKDLPEGLLAPIVAPPNELSKAASDEKFPYWGRIIAEKRLPQRPSPV